jgi:hypothetical protein
MGGRLQLQTLLEELLWSRNVYFQPPGTNLISYPCIIYKRGSLGRTTFADDKPYQKMVRYELTVIDKNPDSDILDRVASLPMCAFERHYTADNLNHDVYNIYY